ncbi:MAG: glycerate kinase [Rhodothalassiaceae bacterium]
MDTAGPARTLLVRLLEAAIAAVHPDRVLPAALPRRPPRGRTLVLGAGKAAAAMAACLARHLDAPFAGAVVVPHGHGAARAGDIALLEGGHPLPDAGSVAAARRFLDEAARLASGDRLIFLASGGGSAALALPLPGLSLARKRDIIAHLLAGGTPIAAINCARRHLSAIKGGRLGAGATARGAELWTLLVSDVAGDDPAAIASGPTIPDPTTVDEARAVLRSSGAPHAAVWEPLLAASSAQTPKPGEFAGEVRLLASGATALAAAADVARAAGCTIHDLGDRIAGEARDVARAHAELARRLRAAGGRHLVLSGGELTVRREDRTGGRGGPNLEYLAALALALDGVPGVHALAADSDGTDGTSGAAGALVSPDSLARAQALGLDAAALLAAHDSRRLFAGLGDLVETGPTGTNVNDLRFILIEE